MFGKEVESNVQEGRLNSILGKGCKFKGTIDVDGTLRIDQESAVAAMLHHDAGIFCAPTGFGKTVTAAALIARRGVNTLVLVHRTELPSNGRNVCSPSWMSARASLARSAEASQS